MTMQSLREAKAEGIDELSLWDSDEIEISFTDSKKPTNFDQLPDYPYQDQEIFCGSYEYESSPRFGSSETASGTFQIRTDSNFLATQTENDRPKPSKVIDAISSNINNGFSAKSEFVPNQESIREFVDSADGVANLKLYTPRGEVEQVEIRGDLSEIPSDRALKSAFLIFELDGEEIEVDYQDGSLRVDPSEDPYLEFILQHFEMAFRNGDS